MTTRPRADVKATVTIPRPYKVTFHKEPEGGYSASVEGLPGCFSEGDTLAEAKRNVREAIACHLEAVAIVGGRPARAGAAKPPKKVPKAPKAMKAAKAPKAPKAKAGR
jgi:predicted RNase H-like HicB family nuclease